MSIKDAGEKSGRSSNHLELPTHGTGHNREKSGTVKSSSAVSREKCIYLFLGSAFPSIHLHSWGCREVGRLALTSSLIWAISIEV